MLKGFKKFINCIYQSVYELIMNDGVERAGYITFLAMLSIFPSLIFFVAMVGLIGDESLTQLLVELIINSPWAEFIEALKPRIQEISEIPPNSLVTIAVVSSMWTASSIFEAIRASLNKTYQVHSPPAYIWRRLLSIIEFTSVIVGTLMLLFALILLPQLFNGISYVFGLSGSEIPFIFTQESQFIRSFFIISFIFILISSIYYYLPNRRQQYVYTLPGTILVLILWSTETSLLKWYLQSFPSINLIYGSIAGVIVALIFFYISSFVFILGGEFNYQIEKNFKLTKRVTKKKN